MKLEKIDFKEIVGLLQEIPKSKRFSDLGQEGTDF
jgi:hypothetical protein